MVDLESGVSCAYLSVLENEAGYDDDYMALIMSTLKEVCATLSHASS